MSPFRHALRSRAALLALALVLALCSPAAATDVDGPDDCVRASQDFGDAPEAVPAYPGVTAAFPTCLAPGPTGSLQLGCPPISLPPGPAGFVRHVNAPLAAFWLGCAPGGAPLGIDSEPDGKMNATGAPASACAGQLAVDCVEPAFTFSFGQDECFGSDDAALAAPPALIACQNATLALNAYNCLAAQREVFLNVCLDMNADGDWNDNFLCPSGACAYEWALKNVPVVLAPGCAPLVTPAFLVGPNAGHAWLRVTLTALPVPDDYPWNGSAATAGAAFEGGETEDYPVDIVGEAPCPEYGDFGDAPDDITAYPSGVVGNFPTCVFPGLIGTRQTACPPISSLPGPTGYVEHRTAAGDPQVFWLGCGAPGADGEADGKLNQAGAGLASVCNPAVLADCTELAFPTMSFGQDECFGDGDAGVSGPIVFEACRPETLRWELFSCRGHEALVYVNVLVDWNEDGDWNDNFLCTGGACVYEWAIANRTLSLLPGCNRGAFVIQAGPRPGLGWMRVTVSGQPVTADFPWAGTALMQPAYLKAGETEDYPVSIVEPDPCGEPYVDYGDAPELMPSYPGSPIAGFPTCTGSAASPDRDDFCIPTAPYGTPGPAGVVVHATAAGDTAAFWLGCGLPGQPELGRDSEADGKMGDFTVTGLASLCAPAVTVDCVESAFGMQFGQDECYGDTDAGLQAFVALQACTLNTVPYAAYSCASAPQTVYLNVLVDMNRDGDWTDLMSCPVAPLPNCPPEWAVQNAAVTLQPGCNALLSPPFAVGAVIGDGWMRVTLSEQPAPPDFAWNGSAAVAGGAFARGETEDYPVGIVQGPVAVGPAAPERLWMAPLAPNPARGRTVARFALPAAARTELAAYDVGGRRVRTLFDGTMSAGEHAVPWDFTDDAGRALPAGLYVVRLEAGGETLVRRAIRIR